MGSSWFRSESLILSQIDTELEHTHPTYKQSAEDKRAAMMLLLWPLDDTTRNTLLKSALQTESLMAFLRDIPLSFDEYETSVHLIIDACNWIESIKASTVKFPEAITVDEAKSLCKNDDVITKFDEMEKDGRSENQETIKTTYEDQLGNYFREKLYSKEFLSPLEEKLSPAQRADLIPHLVDSWLKDKIELGREFLTQFLSTHAEEDKMVILADYELTMTEMNPIKAEALTTLRKHLIQCWQEMTSGNQKTEEGLALKAIIDIPQEEKLKFYKACRKFNTIYAETVTAKHPPSNPLFKVCIAIADFFIFLARQARSGLDATSATHTQERFSREINQVLRPGSH